jgi:hypothetical protein
MQSMAYDEKECLTMGDPLKYKKGVAVQWARRRLKELSEKEKNELYNDLMSGD